TADGFSEQFTQGWEQPKAWDKAGVLGLFENKTQQSLFCLWVGAKNLWLAWRPSGGERRQIGSGMKEHLKRQSGKQAMALVHEESRREKISAVTRPVKKLLGFNSPNTILYHDFQGFEDLVNAYKFLGKQKIPEARSYIESLLSSMHFVQGISEG